MQRQNITTGESVTLKNIIQKGGDPFPDTYSCYCSIYADNRGQKKLIIDRIDGERNLEDGSFEVFILPEHTKKFSQQTDVLLHIESDDMQSSSVKVIKFSVAVYSGVK